MADIAELPTPPPSATDFPDDVVEKLSLDDSHSVFDGVALGSSRKHRYERKMGDTELSYFLPSRQSGVNDM